jgi:hypothetical protein
VPVCSRPLDRTVLHRGRGGPYGVCISCWRNTVNPMGRQATDSTGCKAGQCPGGRGRGRKRRLSGHRRDRATRGGGETQPERVLTSHGSRRTRRRKGHGTHGPHGRAASGTERPWLFVWRVQSLRFRIFRNRLEPDEGKLSCPVLRGRGPGDRLLLPDRPLLRRSRFRQRLSADVSMPLGLTHK